MSNYMGTVHKGLRISPRAVQKWMLLPTGEITEWSADGFSLGDHGGGRDTLWFAENIQAIFNRESKIEVFVKDNADRPVAGMRVDQGWPSHKWPDVDDSVFRLTDDDGKVEWVLFNEFDPMSDIGPIWVKIHGVLLSDVVMGFGIPTTHQHKALITYQVTFRKVSIKQK